MTELLVLENTHNGKVLGLDYMARASSLRDAMGCCCIWMARGFSTQQPRWAWR